MSLVHRSRHLVCILPLLLISIMAVFQLFLLTPQTNRFILEKWNSDVSNHDSNSNSAHELRAPPSHPVPMLYVITPTYFRMEQLADMTRLSQTLRLVQNIHWLVVEDAYRLSPVIASLLVRSNLRYTHLLGPKPEKYNKKTTTKVAPSPVKGSKVTKKAIGGKVETMPIPRGVSNRLAGLKWIKDHVTEGVVYFADDDNTYDVRLFEEMRSTKKVSMWPVALVTNLAISTPIVKNGKVIGFYDGWIAHRKFPVDMAGFAINIAHLLKFNFTMPFKTGYEEDGFLKSINLITSDIEPKAKNCTEIMVWHTRTVKNKVPQRLSANNSKRFNDTNLINLYNILLSGT